MRKLLITLVVLAGALYVVDLGVENLAESRLEERLASAIEGADGVGVDIGGGLFLPQAIGGSFREVTVTAEGVQRGGLQIERVELTLRDLNFSVGDVFNSDGRVSVGQGRGRAILSEGSLNAALSRQGVDATVSLGERAEITAAGVSGEVEEISVDGRGRSLVLQAPPLEPLTLELPRTIRGVDYGDVRVESGQLVLGLRVDRGTVEL